MIRPPAHAAVPMTMLLLLLLDLPAAAQGAKPHLLVALVDDLGYSNVGFHNRAQRSPEIDRLAQEEGVVLEALYTFRYCSPTRSALMSGRFPLHVNQGNPRCVGTLGGIDLRMTLLPAKLRRSGYKTAMIGKGHLGARSERNLPINRGFDYHFGFLGGGEHHFTQGSYECQTASSPRDGYVDLWENNGPAFGQNGTYSCNLYGSKAVQHIEAHDTTYPLFMYVAFHNMHAPDECPSEYIDLGVDPKRRVVQGMVACVSIATGNITDALKRKEMWNNTLMVWSGDNGGFSLGAGNNYPLRGGKMTDYQGGVRVAAFATGGLIPPAMRGTKVLGAMHICDVHAAFCALGGVSDCRDPVSGLPDIDGVDVSPLFFVPEPDRSTVVGNASSPRQEIVLSSAALISGEWKLIFPDMSIPDVSAGACRPPGLPPGDDGAASVGVLEPWDVLPKVVTHENMCAPASVVNGSGCTTAGHYNSIPMASWASCCAACAAQAPGCRAWTYHDRSHATNPGMCILANVSRVKNGVAGATCGTVGQPPRPGPPPPGKDPACGFWTPPQWPTRLGHRDPGFEADPGCPAHGCLFHLPSDPEERHDLSGAYPDKLRELTQRLAQLRQGAYQTMNYTAGFDKCLTVDQVATQYHGFVAPPCVLGNST